ncbi:MAG: hypothetical protein ABMA14_09960 [Hyphomonadaceae bacterium]
MPNPPEMTPAQVAVMDGAFKTDIAEAMKRNSYLLLIRSWLGYGMRGFAPTRLLPRPPPP